MTGDGSRNGCRLITCRDSPCFAGVSCRDTGRGFECGSCPPGYRGDGTRSGCRRINCDDRPCFAGVTCTDSDAGPRCGACPDGYQGDGTRNGCIRVIRRCNTNPCYSGVVCTDTADGFTCGDCPLGYEGDGISCNDINEVMEPFVTLLHYIFPYYDWALIFSAQWLTRVTSWLAVETCRLVLNVPTVHQGFLVVA